MSFGTFISNVHFKNFLLKKNAHSGCFSMRSCRRDDHGRGSPAARRPRRGGRILTNNHRRDRGVRGVVAGAALGAQERPARHRHMVLVRLKLLDHRPGASFHTLNGTRVIDYFLLFLLFLFSILLFLFFFRVDNKLLSKKKLKIMLSSFPHFPFDEELLKGKIK